MRLWSLDPIYLDLKGLSGVWREGLLAQAVLLNKTKRWKNHPQLLRFKSHKYPISAIGFYLLKIYEEAQRRGYSYDRSKIIRSIEDLEPIKITKGQLLYEFKMLKERLKHRAPQKYEELLRLELIESCPKTHPIFVVIEGVIEPWKKSYWRKKKYP